MKTNYISNELLLLSLTNFYRSNIPKLKSILPIIYKSSHISLRLIDWFVTNYSKRFNVIFTKHNVHNKNSEFFNVYSSYRSQLKAFKKIQFDPFRRRERIDFYYNDSEYVETTIGQLNFFRWFVENNLLEYVNEHYVDIEADMIKNQKDADLITTGHTIATKKKTHLSKSLIKHMTHYTGETTVNFV